MLEKLQFHRALKAAACFRWITLLLTFHITNVLAGDIALDSSGRYFQNAEGKPVFLMGYYGWAAVPDGYFIDHPSRYALMIEEAAPFKINYIRISLGVNRLFPGGHPPSHARTTPIPFRYVKAGDAFKANLDQWDPTFWEGLKAQCDLARHKGIIVHVSIFDGVELRQQGGADYGYANSFWNPRNQMKTFYPDPDLNRNGQIDDHGEFYQLNEFNQNHGIGYYQKKLIDKVITELASSDNIFYEVGNELLGSDSNWNSAVISYIKPKTKKAVSQCGGGAATNLMGWSQHAADTPAQVKQNVASIVGHGYPAWEDCDGPALSDANVSPDDLRRAAWYSFAGGAPAWGGFTVDFWNGGRGFSIPTVTYYQNLQTFIQNSKIPFWKMTPQHNLISNSQTNSCLAQTNAAYLAYVLKDPSVTLDLKAESGEIQYILYDPKSGVGTPRQTIMGGQIRTFTKPANSDDWVIYAFAKGQTEIAR